MCRSDKYCEQSENTWTIIELPAELSAATESAHIST